MGAMKCAAHNTRYCNECDMLAAASALPAEVTRANRAREAREAAISARAWQLFCAHIDRGLLDRLGKEDDAGARKAIATAACNALEAAEIFVKTVEE